MGAALAAILKIAKPLWPYIWRALAGIVVVLALWWSWVHFVKDPYIAQGVAQEAVNTAAEKKRGDAAVAANVSLAATLELLKLQIADAKKTIEKLLLDEAQAKKDAAAAAARADAKAKAEKAKIAELQTTVSGPPAPTKEESCEDADKLLDDLAAHRLRNDQ